MSRKFRDGTTGKVFPVLIEHNALIANPVASGLGSFVALSRTDASPAEEVPVFVPAGERNHDMTQDQLAMARELLGQPELPEAEAIDTLLYCIEMSRDQTREAEQVRANYPTVPASTLAAASPPQPLQERRCHLLPQPRHDRRHQEP
jgi:hypothetical protein